MAPVTVPSELRDAIGRGDAVVALESTVIAHGLPYPHNIELARAMEQEVRDHGAAPATIGVIAGAPTVGMSGGDIERFGQSYGWLLYQASHGIDERPLVTHWEPKQRSRERTVQQDTADWQTIARRLAELSRGVADDLKEDGYVGRTIGIKIRFEDFKSLTRDITAQAHTDDAKVIRQLAGQCLKRVPLEKRIRLLGVKVSSLLRAADAAQQHESDLQRRSSRKRENLTLPLFDEP